MISKLFLKNKTSLLLRNKWLWVILIAAFLIRIYNFSSPSFTFEEARIAYRGYALATSADDELGRPLPLLFNSVEDYQLPLISYFSAGGQLLFGKGEFGARILFIVLGTVLVYLVYLIAKNLSKNSLFLNQNTSQPFGLSPQGRRLAAGMNGSQKNLPEGILRSSLWSSSFSLFGASVVAFSPVLIFLSKTPNEAIVLTFIFTLLFYLIVSKRNIWVIILVALASLITSKTAWFILLPFLIFSLLFYSKISNKQKFILVSFCVILVALTLTLFLKVPQSNRSLKENNFPLFDAITIKNGIDKLRGQGLQSGWPPVIDRALFNKSHFLTTGFLHWISGVSPSYYFGRLDSGGIINYSFIGALSKVLIIPFVFGVFYLIKKGSKEERLLLSFVPLLTFPAFFFYPNFKPDLLVLTLPFISLVIPYGFLQMRNRWIVGVLLLVIMEVSINIFSLESEYKNTTNTRPLWMRQLTGEIVESSKTYKTSVSDDIAFDIVPFIGWYTEIDPKSGSLRVDWPYKFRQYQLGNIKVIGSDENFRTCSGDEKMRVFVSERDLEKIEKDFQGRVEKRYKDINKENKAYLLEGVCI